MCVSKPTIENIPGITSQFTTRVRTKGVAIINERTKETYYCNSIAILANIFCKSTSVIYQCLKHKGIELMQYNGDEYYICYASDEKLMHLYQSLLPSRTMR